MNTKLTRRQVIVGVASASAAAILPAALASQAEKLEAAGLGFSGQSFGSIESMPSKRYMASCAVLGDGRLLISGGYSQKWNKGKPPRPLNSVWLYTPATGEWLDVAPMHHARARHASVQLNDGRVAVIGGFNHGPTASIEVYDPNTDMWQVVSSLAQPRYDHSVVSDGRNVYVVGGSGVSMHANIEILPMSAPSAQTPV